MINKYIQLSVFSVVILTSCVSKKHHQELIDKNKQLTEEISKNKVNMTNELDKVSYSLGIGLADNLKSQGIEELNPNALADALTDVFEGKNLKISREESHNLMQAYFQNPQSKKADALKAEGEAFLAANKNKSGVVTLPSGLQYEIITEGNGPKPGPTAQVTTHYHGTLINGEVFDSSVERGQPATFGVNQVIKGWQEALQLMPKGSKWRLFVPYDLAYGDRGAGGKIGPYAALVFEVELIDIK